MESEKVKEIKKGLRCLAGEIPCDLCFYHERAEHQELTCINLVAEDTLDLINELEKDLNYAKNIITWDGVTPLHKWEQEIKAKALKQFAERVKEKLEEYRLENEYFTENEPNGNLWQMNSSVFCIEVTQDDGLIDETLKEFLKE